MKAKNLFIYFSTFVVLYAIILVMLYLGQKHLIFLEEPLEQNAIYNFEFPFEEYNLKHSNGEKINALHFKQKGGDRVILYFHGNSGNLSVWGSNAGYFLDHGYDVFMIDYRGYGKSDGVPTEEALFQDGILAYKTVSKNYKADSITIYGRSLGSAVACHVASKKEINCLILESPLSSIEDVVNVKYPYLYIPYGPVYNFSNKQALTKINHPVYIFHGTQDEVIPLESVFELKEIIKNKGHFFEIEGAGHNDMQMYNSFVSQLDAILK